MAKSDTDETDQLNLALQGGSNLTKLKEDLDVDRKKYLRNKEKIAELNADNTAIRKRVIARGIPAKAFTRQMERAAMDPEKRDQYDLGYEIAGEAFGHPLKVVETIEAQSDKNPRSDPDAGGAKPQTKKAAAKKAPAKKAAAKLTSIKGGKDSSTSLTGLDKAVEKNGAFTTDTPDGTVKH